MGGKQSAEWWREYRARNRDRLNAQQRARRAGRPRDRTRERAVAAARARERRAADAAFVIPAPYTGSDVFDHARLIVHKHARLKPDTRTRVYGDQFEDCVGEVVVALIEGSCAISAIHRFRKREWDWRRFCLTGTQNPMVAAALGAERGNE